ncbi:hypothetical protein ES702_02225 [subsurface metagenome]
MYSHYLKPSPNGLHIELLTVDKLLEYEEEARQGKIL